VVLFFNKFERPIQVTIIQKNSPGLYETVHMVQPLLTKLSPRMIVQDIADHRLFTGNILPSGMVQLIDETQPGQASRPITNRRPNLTWNAPPAAIVDTTKKQDRPPQVLPANQSRPWGSHGVGKVTDHDAQVHLPMHLLGSAYPSHAD